MDIGKAFEIFLGRLLDTPPEMGRLKIGQIASKFLHHQRSLFECPARLQWLSESRLLPKGRVLPESRYHDSFEA